MLYLHPKEQRGAFNKTKRPLVLSKVNLLLKENSKDSAQVSIPAASFLHQSSFCEPPARVSLEEWLSLLPKHSFSAVQVLNEDVMFTVQMQTCRINATFL